MSALWRSILAVYNLLLITISVGTVAMAFGQREPIQWMKAALVTSQNRYLMAGVGIILAIVGCYLMFRLFKTEKNEDVMVKESDDGKAIITIPALKQIIMKSVKQVDGVREIRPEVENGVNGVIVTLTLLVNPDYKVPDMASALQEKVRTQLVEVAGVRVAQVRVRVDDFVAKAPAR